MKEIEPPMPDHAHVFVWEDNGIPYETSIIGARCVFIYEIPPGPRGKKPRIRQCFEFMNMDDILGLINSRAEVMTS